MCECKGKTKQVVFQGEVYTVPVWVRYITRDGNGSVDGWETEPMYRIPAKEWEHKSKNPGRSLCLVHPPRYDSFGSLTKV